MRRVFASLGVISVAACGSPAPPPAPNTRIPFRLSSIVSTYLVRGEITGTATVGADSIIIDVARLHWARAENGVTASDAILHQLTLSAGLAYVGLSKVGWDLDAAAERPLLRDSVVGLDSGTAGPFRFAIQRPLGSILESEWIAFRFDYALPPRQPGVVMEQRSSICSRRDFFAPPYADTVGSGHGRVAYARWC